MRKKRQIISAVCAGILSISAIYPSAVPGGSGQIFAASSDQNIDSGITADESDITMEGTNSFGTLLADTLSEEQEEQEKNHGCNIFEVTVEGTEAYVSFETIQDATIVVGIYTETGEEMLASGIAEVFGGEQETYIEIETEQMPQYFLLRAFMVDEETLAPLCTFYESPNYTQEMQEFFAKTTNDFEEEKVLNLDEDKTNNFAVYKDDVVLVQPQDNVNQVVLADEENGVYVIENADDTILALQTGDTFSYQYDESNLLIVKVKKIEKEGTTVTITAEDSSLDEVFEYVKIDSEAGMEQAEIDPGTCEEGVIYNGLTEWTEEDGIETYGLDVEESTSLSASYTFKEKEFEADGSLGNVSGSASVKVSGGVDIEMTHFIKVYISLSYQYIEWKLDYAAKIKANVTGEISGKIMLGQVTISPVPGVYIEFTPSFVVEASAEIELSGELKGTIGFKVEKDTGIKNISSTPTFQAEAKVEGTIFLGLSLEPEIKIINERIANAELEAVVGAEISAELQFIEVEFSEDSEESEHHDCAQCLEGEIYGKFEVHFEVQLVNSKKLKHEA